MFDGILIKPLDCNEPGAGFNCFYLERLLMKYWKLFFKLLLPRQVNLLSIKYKPNEVISANVLSIDQIIVLLLKAKAT